VAIAGANHVAIGEMAMSALYLERISAELDRLAIRGGGVKIYVARGATSKAVGQKKINKVKICEKYGLEWVKVLEKNEIIGYNILVEHFADRQY
jgi:hypothetical protein